jgi:hypothetical protein
MIPNVMQRNRRPGGIMNAGWKLLTAAMLAGMLATPASSAPLIDWDPAFFYEPGATFDNSIPLSEMKIVGVVSVFGGALTYLNASMPGTEYTFFLEDLISDGTATIGPIATQFYITTYTGGTIKIYQDSSPDYAFTPNPENGDVPSTFTDGTVILSGTINGFFTQTNNFSSTQTGNAEGHITWTGGTLLGLMGDTACLDLFTGGLTWSQLPNVGIAGYLFRHDGKIDDECPTPTRPSTWGRMKALYR